MKRPFWQRKGAAERTAAPSSSRCGDQLVCWIAESSQSAPRRRAKVHTSVTSTGVSLPATRRPVVRSVVLSTSENFIATLATPEMVSYFSKDLEETKARNDLNKVTDVKLLQGDLRSLA